MAKRVGARSLTNEQQATALRIGQRYETRRAELGLTQTQAANRLARHMPTKYSQHSSTVSRLERGLHWPDVYIAAALARAYGKTLEEMAPELVPEAQRMGMFLAAVVDLTECAPWELNPQPAASHSVAVQPSFFDDGWDAGGSSEPLRRVIDLTVEPAVERFERVELIAS